MLVACSPTGYEKLDEAEAADEYLIVSRHLVEDRFTLLRSDRELLREILRDTLPHVNNLRIIDRAKRALDITASRPVRFL